MKFEEVKQKGEKYLFQNYGRLDIAFEYGKGMYLWLKPATVVRSEWCHDPELKKLVDSNGGVLMALGTICMYTHDSTGRNAILTGWLASQSDMLLEDWEIVE